MSEQPGRFAWLTELARKWLMGALVLVGLALVYSISKLIGDLHNCPSGQMATVICGGVLSIVAELLAAVGAALLYGVIQMLESMEGNLLGVTAYTARIQSATDDASASLKKLVELATLSDQAKSLVYRDRELDAFRERIHEDLIHQEYQTASALIETLDKKLGYAEEAARLRDEVNASRKATVDEKIDTAINRIHEIITRFDWATALREAQRLTKLFPQNKKVTALPEEIEAGRSTHKRELLQAYGEAVRKNDVDHSIELLKELDRYLTPQEAAALQDSARGVFKARLHNLGVQFAISVSDRQWAKAISVGEEIIGEYPKSRMAQEVREKLDQLRTRAAKSEKGGPDDKV